LVKYVLETKRFTEYVKASNGRGFPSFKDVAADQSFHDPKDPHVSLATEQHSKYPTRPFYYSYHHAYSQVYTENVWGKAISRVVTEKWSNEQAVDTVRPMNGTAAVTVDYFIAVHRERWRGKTILGLAFCSPLILIFLLLIITPIVYMLYLGLDWTIYSAIFSDPIFLQTLWSTLIFVGIVVNVKIFLALTLSAPFSTEYRITRILAGVFLLPWAIPALPGILAFRWMLNGEWGIVNKVLNDLGFASIPWLVRRQTAPGAAIVYHIWKYLPFWTLIFVAGRRSIPT